MSEFEHLKQRLSTCGQSDQEVPHVTFVYGLCNISKSHVSCESVIARVATLLDAMLDTEIHARREWESLAGCKTECEQ